MMKIYTTPDISIEELFVADTTNAGNDDNSVPAVAVPGIKTND